MKRRALAALAVTAALMAAARSEATEATEGTNAPEATEASGGDAAAAKGEGEENGEVEKKDYVFLTGLDFSYWAADEATTVWGPGLTLGFVLIPDHLELGVAVGAMLGGHHYTIPVEVAFTVPFHVNEWFAPFVKVGPTILTDKTQDDTQYDVAASFGAGVEFLPVGFDWGVYVGGDYNVRTLHEVRHQGGFTIGFHYRV
jgi:hypothetical protein